MSRAATADPSDAAWTREERNAFGLLVFLAAEAMFFAGLISTFLILRAGSAAWPPAGQPRLPVVVTAANTGVLLLAAVTMHAALVAVRRGRTVIAIRRLAATLLLGGTFLAVQGVEWLRLMHHGLQASTGPYGSTFFTLIGAHALHVIGALAALALVLRRAVAGRYDQHRHGGIELCWMYWCFVVGLWPLLYVLVYLI